LEDVEDIREDLARVLAVVQALAPARDHGERVSRRKEK